MVQCCWIWLVGSYGSWYGRRRGSWGGRSEVRSDVEWFCQKCGTGNWWSRTDCRHCASVTSHDSDVPQSSTQEKLLSWRRRWLVWATTSLFAERPEVNGKAHRGQTELDQQRIQTPRGGNCKADGIAREPQSTKRNLESGLRGDQDSQRRPAERGRIDGQKQVPLRLRRARRKFGDSSNRNWRSGEARLRRDWLGGHETVQRRKSLVG